MKALHNSSTSMLNTKVRAPSPARMFSSTSCILSSPFGQAGWRSFGQMSVFRSHRAPLLGAADDLVRGALHIFRRHLDRVVPTLRQILRSVSSASPVSVSPPCRNDVNDSSSRSSAARITSFTFSAHVREVCLVWLLPCRPRSAIAPIAGQHRTADAVALDRFQFRNQFGM